MGSIPGQEDPLEKKMAAHPSILAWEIPWTEEPGGLQSTGSKRVRHDFATEQQQQCGLSHQFFDVIMPKTQLLENMPPAKSILQHDQDVRK